MSDVDVPVGFDAVTNDRRRFSERSLHLLQMMHQCRGAVDEQRRAVLLGQFGERNVFAVENVVAVLEVVHGCR